MNKETAAYDFKFRGDQNNTYVFETESGITYQVQFKPSGYVFEQWPFSDVTFELAIYVIENPLSKGLRLDGRISTTLAAIVLDFYRGHDENIIVYICASSDERQSVRKRKFNIWFDHFKNYGYVKIDESILDNSGHEYFLSLFAKSTNPDLVRIFEAFTRLINGYNDK